MIADCAPHTLLFFTCSNTAFNKYVALFFVSNSVVYSIGLRYVKRQRRHKRASRASCLRSCCLIMPASSRQDQKLSSGLMLVPFMCLPLAKNCSMSKCYVAQSYSVQSSQFLLRSKQTIQVSRVKAFSRETMMKASLRTTKLRWLRLRYVSGMPSLAFMPATLHSLVSPAVGKRFFAVRTLRLVPHFGEGW